MKKPLEIRKVKDPDGVERLRAMISLQDAVAHPSSNKQLIDIQNKYRDFIENCKTQLKHIHQNRKNRGDSILKWKLADTIYKFIKDVEAEGYSFANITESLSRDLPVSARQINYLLEFRVTYPHNNLVRKDISWDKYKELLDIDTPTARKICMEEIVRGKLKTREDIRKFKKKLKQRIK